MTLDPDTLARLRRDPYNAEPDEVLALLDGYAPDATAEPWESRPDVRERFGVVMAERDAALARIDALEAALAATVEGLLRGGQSSAGRCLLALNALIKHGVITEHGTPIAAVAATTTTTED